MLVFIKLLNNYCLGVVVKLWMSFRNY